MFFRDFALFADFWCLVGGDFVALLRGFLVGVFAVLHFLHVKKRVFCTFFRVSTCDFFPNCAGVAFFTQNRTFL